ncbi:MAG: hypothetical protein QNL93_05770, partial [Opitutae bacterium]
MKNLKIPFYLFLFPLFLLGQETTPLEIVDAKGAIIIAQLEGEVSVVNNSTGLPLPPEKVQAGGILFDG